MRVFHHDENGEPIDKSATELRSLSIFEISGVDDPANEIPGWILMKAKATDDPDAAMEKLGAGLANGSITPHQGAEIVAEIAKARGVNAIDAQITYWHGVAKACAEQIWRDQFDEGLKQLVVKADTGPRTTGVIGALLGGSRMVRLS